MLVTPASFRRDRKTTVSGQSELYNETLSWGENEGWGEKNERKKEVRKIRGRG